VTASAIGLDLLEIDRLEAALERRPRLAERLFTAGEREYAAARIRPGQHLAARFCAKEAVAKALRLQAWSWQDIEVVSGADGPHVLLHGALARLGIDVDVSLTHTRGMAGAVALVRGAGAEPTG
jgi:holo-[acyl-carrier protein] synthase